MKNIKKLFFDYFNKALAIVKNINIKNIFSKLDGAILKFADSFNVIENKFSKKGKKDGQKYR